MYVHDPNANPGPLLRPPYFVGEPPRSAIPKVIGILAIVFASFGVLGTLGLTFGMEDELSRYRITRDALGSFGTWMIVSGVFGFALFGVHLTMGIQAVRYAPSAPRWATIYGVLAIALVLADIIVSMATFPDGHGYRHRQAYEDLVYPRIGLAIFALPWPIIALILMNVRGARRSCVEQPL